METFIHIPKTGGTTIVQTLSNQIYFGEFKRLNPTRDTHPKKFLAEVESLIDKVLTTQPQVKVIGGHFGFAAHPSLKDPGQHFTVLRDPVERAVSEYYYMKHKNMYYQELIQGENLSLEAYLTHPEVNYLNNLQTRLISGVSYENGDQVTEEIYHLAVENIRQFKAIGLTESMDKTLALFYTLLHWKRRPYYTWSNSNDQRPNREVSEEALEIIKERDKYDIKLYALGVGLFEQMIVSNKPAIDKVLDKILKPSIAYKLLRKVQSKASHRLGY